MKYFLFLSLVCLLSCKAQKQLGDQIEGLVLLEQDGYSGIETFEIQAIRDTKSLNKFYTQINKTRKPGLPVPMVDFSQEMVLVVCLGKQQGEPSVTLFKSSETATDLTVIVQLSNSNRPELANTQPVTNPFYLYKMPLTEKTIIFQVAEK